MRNPKRTATTAAALMIGVALVGFITILASSTTRSVEASMERAFTGDLVVSVGQRHGRRSQPAVGRRARRRSQRSMWPAVSGLRRR